jgi:hypothetical protein
MAVFFATPDDLLPVLLSIESRRPVVYTLFGSSSKPRVDHYTTARDLPTLFQPQPYGSAISGPAYFVTEAGTDVIIRHIRLNDGEDRWDVDQLANPDSTVLRHGGFYGDKVLLEGEVRTAYKTKAAVRLQRAFDNAIRKHFVKMVSFSTAYYLGSRAVAFLDSGGRLTSAEGRPPEYDIVLRAAQATAPLSEVVRKRRSLVDTWWYLESEGEQSPRHPDGRPFVPDRMPSSGDELPFGLSYFRTGLEEVDRSKLTMPRTFFGRSRFVRVNFSDTDLSESRMCWNDFDDCDFSGADLSASDMRASHFTGCKFVSAVLRRADLRRSTFRECDFAAADLTDAIAVDSPGGLRDVLSGKEQAVIAWTEDHGPEPPGG